MDVENEAQFELDHSGACRACRGERDPATPEDITRLRGELDACMARGAYGEAYPIALHLLEDADDLYAGEGEDYATVLNDVASVERYIGQYQKAEQRFSRAGEILRETRGEKDPEYATTINNLAGLHRLTRNFDSAEQEFNQALSIYLEAVGEYDWRTVSAYNNLGLLYQDQKRFDEALGCHMHALEVLQSPEMGENPGSIATTLMNAAICTSRMGDDAGADELFERALDLTEKVNGRKSASFAGALNNVASFRASQGDFVRAAELLKESQTIAGQLFGTNSPAYQLVCKNLANVQAQIDNKDA